MVLWTLLTQCFYLLALYREVILANTNHKKSPSIHNHISQIKQVICMQSACTGMMVNLLLLISVTVQEIRLTMHQCGLRPQDLLCPNTLCSCSN